MLAVLHRLCSVMLVLLLLIIVIILRLLRRLAHQLADRLLFQLGVS